MNTKKIFKKIFVIVIVISFCVSFTGYINSSQNLDDQAYVMAIGVDVGSTGKYKISLQLSTLESNASESSIKSSNDNSSDNNSNSSKSSNYIIHTVETDSIDNAINITDAYLNRNANLSHCRILLLSEEIAKNGIADIVNSLINKVEIRPDCNIIIAKIPENEFKDTNDAQIEDVLSKYYDVTSNVETGRGYSELVKLNDFYFNLNDYFCQPYATLGITSNSTQNTNNNSENDELDTQSRSLVSNPSEKTNVENIGLAVFKGDTLVGTLSADETLCHEIIRDNLNYCTVNMPSPFDNNQTMDIQISHLKKPKITVKISNDSPFVEFKIYLTVKMLSFNNTTDNILTEDKLNIITQSVSEYFEKQFYNYFDKTSKELKSDIANIGKYAVKNFATIEDWENYNWLENYKNATFKVTILPSVKSGYLLTNE